MHEKFSSQSLSPNREQPINENKAGHTRNSTVMNSPRQKSPMAVVVSDSQEDSRSSEVVFETQAAEVSLFTEQKQFVLPMLSNALYDQTQKQLHKYPYSYTTHLSSRMRGHSGSLQSASPVKKRMNIESGDESPVKLENEKYLVDSRLKQYLTQIKQLKAEIKRLKEHKKAFQSKVKGQGVLEEQLKNLLQRNRQLERENGPIQKVIDSFKDREVEYLDKIAKLEQEIIDRLAQQQQKFEKQLKEKDSEQF